MRWTKRTKWFLYDWAPEISLILSVLSMVVAVAAVAKSLAEKITCP